MTVTSEKTIAQHQESIARLESEISFLEAQKSALGEDLSKLESQLGQFDPDKIAGQESGAFSELLRRRRDLLLQLQDKRKLSGEECQIIDRRIIQLQQGLEQARIELRLCELGERLPQLEKEFHGRRKRTGEARSKFIAALRETAAIAVEVNNLRYERSQLSGNREPQFCSTPDFANIPEILEATGTHLEGAYQLVLVTAGTGAETDFFPSFERSDL